MVAGIQVFGDAGNVQITDQFVSMNFLETRTVQIVNSLSYSPARWGEVTVAGDNPIAVLGSTGGAAVVQYKRTNLGNGQWRFTFAAGFAVSVKMFFFERSKSIPAGNNFGLQLFNASGELCFDSATPVMSVRAVHQTTTSTSSFALPGGSSVYGAQLSFTRTSINLISSGGQQQVWEVVLDGLIVSSTTVSRASLPVWTTTAENEAPRAPQTTNLPQILVADVTHL
ncbi:hypothetical protein [Metapseudomonas furukawaii]